MMKSGFPPGFGLKPIINKVVKKLGPKFGLKKIKQGKFVQPKRIVPSTGLNAPGSAKAYYERLARIKDPEAAPLKPIDGRGLAGPNKLTRSVYEWTVMTAVGGTLFGAAEIYLGAGAAVALATLKGLFLAGKWTPTSASPEDAGFWTMSPTLFGPKTLLGRLYYGTYGKTNGSNGQSVVKNNPNKWRVPKKPSIPTRRAPRQEPDPIRQKRPAWMKRKAPWSTPPSVQRPPMRTRGPNRRDFRNPTNVYPQQAGIGLDEEWEYLLEDPKKRRLS